MKDPTTIINEYLEFAKEFYGDTFMLVDNDEEFDSFKEDAYDYVYDEYLKEYIIKRFNRTPFQVCVENF